MPVNVLQRVKLTQGAYAHHVEQGVERFFRRDLVGTVLRKRDPYEVWVQFDEMPDLGVVSADDAYIFYEDLLAPLEEETVLAPPLPPMPPSLTTGQVRTIERQFVEREVHDPYPDLNQGEVTATSVANNAIRRLIEVPAPRPRAVPRLTTDSNGRVAHYFHEWSGLEDSPEAQDGSV